MKNSNFSFSFKKLIKSRENLRNYLINMPIPYNNDDFGQLNDNTKCTNTIENQELGISVSFEKISVFEQIPNKLQEWDKTSIVSQISKFGASTKKLPTTNKIGSSSNLNLLTRNKTIVKKMNNSTLKPDKILGGPVKSQRDLWETKSNCPVSQYNKPLNEQKKHLNEKIEPVIKIYNEEKKEMHKVASSKIKIEGSSPKGRKTSINSLSNIGIKDRKTVNKSPMINGRKDLKEDKKK